MHDLEHWIAQWRVSAAQAPDLTDEALDELEDHLRESAEALVRSGVGAPEAVRRAAVQLGAMPGIASEFRKLEASRWLPVKVITFLWLATSLVVAVLVTFAQRPGSSGLLASHVFMITLGYAGVLFTGALGGCFVIQRCFSEFSPSRLRSIRQASMVFTSLALGLTGVGVALGALWAKAAWGRYWAWDLKETGGLCVVVWLISLLVAHRWARRHAGALLTTSILGNMVVVLAWFGPACLASMQSHGAAQLGWMMWIPVWIVSNLVLFMLGWRRITAGAEISRGDAEAQRK